MRKFKVKRKVRIVDVPNVGRMIRIAYLGARGEVLRVEYRWPRAGATHTAATPRSRTREATAQT